MNHSPPQVNKVIFIISLLLIGLTLIVSGRVIPTPSTLRADSLKTGLGILDALFVLVGLILLRGRSKLKGLLDALIGVYITLMLLVGVEATYFMLNGFHQESHRVWFEGGYAQGFLQDDELLGYKPKPQTQLSSIKKRDGEVLYSVTYSIDAYSRRITPVDNSKPRSNFMLFFGDSFTFGEGVNDDQTLPFYMSQLAPTYQPYNYGVGGYGPQQMLAKLQNDDIIKEITETTGILIYTFIDPQVDRAIGSMYVYNAWGSTMPFYTLDAEGRLIRNGNFTTGRPGLSFLYNLLGKSQTATYFHLNLPLSITDEHLKFTVKLLEESQQVFKSKFRSDDFYVIIFPGHGETYAPRMMPYLDEAHIKYLDYNNLFDRSSAALWIPDDGHPTAKAYQIVAERLAQNLGLTH